MAEFVLRCTECGRSYDEGPTRLVCDPCAAQPGARGAPRGLLEVELTAPPEAWPDGGFSSPEWLAAFLPLPALEAARLLPPVPVGGTPLLAAPRLRSELGMPNLWIKDDTRNPSGSTKDRASLLVVAKARQYGLDSIATASSGNAAVALGALCAAAGLRAVTLVPAAAPEAKLVQLRCYGAEVLLVDGTYDAAYELCLDLCRDRGFYNRSTALNPFTTEGKKTAALEIAAQLGSTEADVVVVPVGDGVVLSGIAKGFADLQRGGLLRRRPRLIAVQPEGSAAIARALEAGANTVTPLDSASTVADSLSVEVPRGGATALAAVRASGGAGVTVSDGAIIEAIAELARTTGVFAEPAAAASLAGLRIARENGLIDRDERVVLLVTGTGLKDIPAAARSVGTGEN